jgi:uncharacterized protein (UPF0276 family)
MRTTTGSGLGCGVGLRREHYALVTEQRPAMDWFEAISENFMDSAGRPLQVLEAVRHRYPVALHGVSLSIGTTDPLDEAYLRRLAALAERIQPVSVSDHLCWAGIGGHSIHDLLPLPFTEEALRHVVERVHRVQELLGRRILLENISSYVTFAHSEMPEWEFVAEVARRSGCGLLLDVNNVYVNAFNHQFDPMRYLEALPAGSVEQIHLAGHTDMGEFLFDTHSAPVIEAVWTLYRAALRRFGRVATMIEWDEGVPSFETLVAEAATARTIQSLEDVAGAEPMTIPMPTAEPGAVLRGRC